jgi:hypothetical protein
MKCLECNGEFLTLNKFNRHINNIHGGQFYFDKYLKIENVGFCKTCGKPTEFIHINLGYKNCCSKECSNTYTYSQTRLGNLKKYGIENPYQRKNIKEKIAQSNLINFGVRTPLENKAIKEKAYKTMEELYGGKTTLESNMLTNKFLDTNIERYGNKYAVSSEDIQNKIKTTNIKKYGCENPMGNKKVRNKRKKTMIKIYGSEHALQNKDCQSKFRNTCIEKFGVEYPMQNSELFDKNQKSCFRTKIFRDTNILYQASYELDFLEKYYETYNDIERAKHISYVYNGKKKVYYPDFFIPSLNLIVECKNSYLYKRDKLIIEAKEKATIANGFKYCLILNKDYTEFDLIN